MRGTSRSSTCILLVWPLVFYALGLYGRQGRTLSSETSVILSAVAIAGLLLIAFIFTARQMFISRPVIVAFLLLDFVRWWACGDWSAGC